MRFAADEKIAAIKKFREMVPGTGLADAKHVIENFQSYLAAIDRLGRLPKIVDYRFE